MPMRRYTQLILADWNVITVSLVLVGVQNRKLGKIAEKETQKWNLSQMKNGCEIKRNIPFNLQLCIHNHFAI